MPTSIAFTMNRSIWAATIGAGLRLVPQPRRAATSSPIGTRKPLLPLYR